MRLTLALAIAALSISAVAEVIEVPLHYLENPPDDRGGLTVSRVRVADFDMLAPGAAPAPLDIDFNTSRSRGLALAYEDFMESATIAGRNCRRSLISFAINVDDKCVLNGDRPNIYVLVDYLDDGTSNPKHLRFTYDGMTNGIPDPIPYKYVIGPDLGHRGTWKQYQFHVRDAYFGNRQKSRVTRSGPADFLLLAWETDSFHAYGSVQLQKSYDLPPGEWKQPPAVSARPIYSLIQLGDQSRLARFDRDASGGPSYNRLIFDANGNHDLTDDAVFQASAVMDNEGTWSVNFPLEATCSAGGVSQPVKWDLTLQIPFSIDPPSIDRVGLFVRLQNYRGGSFQWNGKRYRVALVDANCNGMFSSSLERGIAGDLLYVTAREHFAPDGYLTGELSKFVLGDYLMLGSNLFKVTFDPLGTLLKLEGVPEPGGTLRLGADAVVLQVYAEEPWHCIALVDPPREVRVPPGRYTLGSYGMERKDPQGDTWQLRAVIEQKSRSVVVTADQPGELVFGETFSPSIMTRGTLPKPGEKPAVEIETSLVGRGGEIVRAIVHAHGTLTQLPLSTSRPLEPREPTYRIVMLDGEIVASGSFEYG